ncbi:hypothetical protein Tco_0807624 [Tanacetum coccineum]
MSSLRELAALSNSSELKEQMLYANRLEMTKSCLISDELNRVIGYLTRQINSRENLIEKLPEYGVLPSYDNDIDIPIVDTDEVVIADTDEVVIADIPEDKQKQRNRNYYTRNILVNRGNGVGCSLEDIDESGIFMPDSSHIRFDNGVLEEDPYDFVYDGLPSQCHVLKDSRFCVKCGAKKFEFEYPTLCCMGGKTKLVDPNIPQDLYNLFISQCDVGKRFRRSIRAYYTNFSFTSMGVQLDESVTNMTSGVYTFRAHGGIYHKIDQLVLRDGKPRYLQLYFYDDDEELQHRLSWNNLDEDIVRRLASVLAQNPYVQTFQSLRELGPLDNYRVGLKKDLKLASIWIEGNDNISAYERSVVIYGRFEYPETIQPHYGFYDPMSSVLFFPYGETGWHSKIKRFLENEDDNVSDNSSEEDEEVYSRGSVALATASSGCS